MFTSKCFIRVNKPYIIDRLIDLGYVKALFDEEYTKSEAYGLIVDQGDIVPLEHPLQEDELMFTYNFIDCGDNEELFIALAALRDDSDYMQWFIIDETYHKMSAEELIEHAEIIKKNMKFEIGETVSIGKKDKHKQGKIVEIVLAPEIKAYDKYYVININGENLCYLEKEIHKL